jgi:hypothetical protein
VVGDPAFIGREELKVRGSKPPIHILPSKEKASKGGLHLLLFSCILIINRIFRLREQAGVNPAQYRLL